MDDYGNSIRRVIKFTFYFLSLCLFAWAVTEFKTVFAGLALGTSISLYNSIITARRIHRLGELALSGEKKAISLGTLIRFSSSVLAGLIALRFPQAFHFPATVAGLVVCQAIALIDGIYLHIRSTLERSGKG